MKHLNWLILLLALLFPGAGRAAMGDYCSAPPYVTRSIAPNIMVLMDNSINMMQPAHAGDYAANATFDNYPGYFVPDSCYNYTSKFVEVLKRAPNVPPAPRNPAPTCTAAAPFRGNLMNWATMSKYDVLQKVLIGGNSVSKQANANTLLSISGTFPDRTYESCKFIVSDGNLTITEINPGDCILLNNPAEIIAAAPRRATPTIGTLLGQMAPERSIDWSRTAGTPPLPAPAPAAAERPRTPAPTAALQTAIAAIGGAAPSLEVAALWSGLDFPATAWAAPACGNTTISALNATVGSPYTLTLSAACNNCSSVFTWSSITMPAWLTGPTYKTPNPTSHGATDYTATWTGTPPAAGTYAFSATVNGSNCVGAKVSAGNIVAAAAPLQIVQPSSLSTALPPGMVGVPYSYSTTAGLGGVPPRSWAVSSLPSGLAVASATGYITGTPSATSNANVTFTLSDSAGTTAATRSLNLTIVANDLSIITSTLLPRATLNQPYTPFTLQGTGGVPPYTWAITSGSLPTGITLSAAGVISGTPTVDVDTASLIIRLTDSTGTSVQKINFNFTVDIATAVPTMTSRLQPLAAAARGELFTFQLIGVGGTPDYHWTRTATTVLSSDGPLTVSDSGLVSWNIPKNQATGDYTFTVTMVDNNGIAATHVTGLPAVHHITVVRALALRSSSFNVKVDIDEETLTDLNGNDSWDLGEVYTDSNGNGQWDGKTGIFQKFWDSNIPKARWGMTKFGRTDPNIATCIPASPVASWYTGIQNATPADSSALASGLYSAIKYYGFSGGFSGCTNSDPIDNIPCRKNFILMISSGYDVTGTAYPADATLGCTQSEPLVRNACVGFKTDLRSEASGKQNVYTYVVNTMGENAANNTILEDTANAGGGSNGNHYYNATAAATLESQLVAALQDILSQAASGTAVSVLTTSSRGIGSMVQAYFLPVRTDGTRDVAWTGYTQDLWIDPQDNLREDSVQDLIMKPVEDKVVKLFFDAATNETRVARFTTLEDGSGGTLGTCEAGEIEPFSATKYLWEAGQKLALASAADRDLFTAKKVIHGTSTTHTISSNTFTSTNIVGDTTLEPALNAQAPYSATSIVDYVRGVDYESATPASYRDRRLTIGGTLRVWKLGDIISSTPKVFANTPANTYHIDYGDRTYYSYVTGDGYKQRASVAFVGANDGVLHAFRVGYLKDTGLEAGIKGLFQNTHDDTTNTGIGQEMWGYIPFNSFPYLQYLANPGYCHIYFNDLSVRIVDASIGAPGTATDPADAKALASWRSILIGGMRFGGACAGGTPAPPLAGIGYSSYYAIDVTDPTDPIPLWEFSDPDMGHATTFPSILRTGSDKNANGNWYVAIGSGSSRMPKSSTDMARTTVGYVYFLDLKSGDLIKKVDLGHNAIVSDIVAIDSHKDANVDALYFGTAYPSGTSWGGKLMTLNVAGNVPDLCGSGTTRTAAQCGIAEKVLFNGTFPFTASPDVARDASGNVWIYAGAGKYISDVDEADNNNTLFLGIKTNLAAASYPIQIGVTAATDFIDRTNVTTTGTVTSTRFDCLYNPAGSGTTQFTRQEVVTGIAPTSTSVSVPPMGWYISLIDGERVISRPLAVGGLVDFLTYKPSSDLCSYGGSSYLYAVDYLKGIAPTNVAIRSPSTTTSTSTGANAVSGEVTVNKGILLGPGAPPTGEAITIPPPKEGQEQLKKKIQIATGVIVEAENTPVISTISKVVHWLKK